MLQISNSNPPSPPTQSRSLSTSCEIQTKYLRYWDKRRLSISMNNNLLEITSSSGQTKTFPLDQVILSPQSSKNHYYLNVPSGRKYKIKSNPQVSSALQNISYYHTCQNLLPTVKQQSVPLPKKLNYFAPVRSLSFQQDYIPTHRSSILIKDNFKKQSIILQPKQQIQRLSSYLKINDWQRDPNNGGITFINQQKKSIISKMIKYVISRVLSTGSFMGISFPTFAMKPQTMLETYCKCLGAAPLLFDNCPNTPLDRIKAFNALVQTISVLFHDIQKPFNPVIGQTFQGQIGGYPVYAQQVSHHPPITGFFMDGKNYAIHATLQLNASLGLNSATGYFYGQLVLQFDDGAVIRGRLPNGTLTGVVFGETHFMPCGAVYSYDPINHMISTYEVIKKDIFTGIIGILKPNAFDKFMKMINAKSKDKYQKYQNIKQIQFTTIQSRIQIKWTQYIKYDNILYFNMKQQSKLPIKLTQNLIGINQQLLPSDSSYRYDIKLRAMNKMEQSQQEKQKLENQQRKYRKIREKYSGLPSRNSII